MRRLAETWLILIFACIPLGSLSAVTERLPLILPGISLCYLVLFSMVSYSEYFGAAAFLVLWYFFPELYLMAPVMAYALSQRQRPLAAVPLLAVLYPVRPLYLLLLGLALWLSYQELKSREREKAYLAMRDDFVQNDLLQRRILKEEELNHQKNLEIAILKERNRISREIHDSVGHTISAGILQIEAMKLSAPDPLKEKLTGLSAAMSKGMEEVRNSLHNLHNESISLKAEIEELTGPLAEGYEVAVDLQMDEEVPLEIKRAVLSMLRESLTNISKHSDADTIRISVRELPQHYTASVKDNGTQKDIKSGLGLVSMEEMARSLGGALSKGWSDGFYVHLTLPKARPVTDRKKQEEPKE